MLLKFLTWVYLYLLVLTDSLILITPSSSPYSPPSSPVPLLLPRFSFSLIGRSCVERSICCPAEERASVIDTALGDRRWLDESV